MRLKGRQARFVLGTVGGWTIIRGGSPWLAGLAAVGLPMLDAPRAPLAPLDWPSPLALAGFRPAAGAARPARARDRAATPASGKSAPPAPRPAPDTPAGLVRLAVARFYQGSPIALLRHATFASAPGRRGDAAPFTSQVLAAPRGAARRLSGQAYLFVRPGGGRASLAAGGELGGSQAAARLAYRLNDGPVTRTAIAARLYAPLASMGAEAAVGLDWYPVASVPVRVSVERRIDLDGHGRNAWSAYTAGGFYLERLGGRLALDGYGQAGVVGAARRDLFVDGALRAGRRVPLAGGVLTAGAGLWGAAQPGVARLDAGPRLAFSLPVARTTLSLAVEGRFRVAGRAAPGSGAAVTLASAF